MYYEPSVKRRREAAISCKNGLLRQHYREQWLPWEDCELLIPEYCKLNALVAKAVIFQNIVDFTAVGS
ncbi:hypothetical protein ADL26_15840 [Thermoactinomyces vulgaris]|jgi:hypothetical protein|nr:hypothetical protein ADL26_15840 [Thermoactinomyces vulgaris]